MLPALAAHGRCLALDQRGHGKSACDGDDYSLDAFASDAAEVIDRLGRGCAPQELRPVANCPREIDIVDFTVA